MPEQPDLRKAQRHTWYDSTLEVSGYLVLTPAAEHLWTWEFSILNARGVVPTYRTLYKTSGGLPTTANDAEAQATALWRQFRQQVATERDALEADDAPPECAVVLRQSGRYYALALEDTPREVRDSLAQVLTAPDGPRARYVMAAPDLFEASGAVLEVFRRLLGDRGKES